MRILICGAQNVVKESIVKLAMDKMQANPPVAFLSFSDFVEIDARAGEEIGFLKKMQSAMADSLQLRMLKSQKSSVVVSGYSTIRTRAGYFPVISESMISMLRPDIIVHIDVDHMALPKKTDDVEGFRDQQKMEKMCSVSFSLHLGVPLKIIRCGLDGSRKASEELAKFIKEVLVGR